MLYYLAEILKPYFGPFRLLQSHALLLAGGTFVAALVTWILLPRLWPRLPRDRGKVLCKDMDGMKSAGKPTGAGLCVSLICLPVIILFAPLRCWDFAAVLTLYGAMLFGYLDDRSLVPWGELKKGLLDAVVSIAIAVFIFLGHSEWSAQGTEVMICWLPFWKGMVSIPFLDLCAYGGIHPLVHNERD